MVLTAWRRRVRLLLVNGEQICIQLKLRSTVLEFVGQSTRRKLILELNVFCGYPPALAARRVAGLPVGQGAAIFT